MIKKSWVFTLYLVLALTTLGFLSNNVTLASSTPVQEPEDLFFMIPEANVQEQGGFRAEWNYTFLRDNEPRRVFNRSQSITGMRRYHRKAHLVDWNFKYGLTDVLQAEAQVVYKAYRQVVLSEAGKGNIDDGDFDRLFAALSYQVLRETDEHPGMRTRVGLLWPNRAENEDIGQGAGFDLMTNVSRHYGSWFVNGNVGFTMTFNNDIEPADTIFELTSRSKEHDFRTFLAGIGFSRSLNDNWQANMELDGRLFDRIELNERESQTEIRFTPGVYYQSDHPSWKGWVGFGVPIGITSDANHIGVAIRTGMTF